jgi:hypothetical protein
VPIGIETPHRHRGVGACRSTRQSLSKTFFELGAWLAALRERGIRIVGSGNVVHHLRRMNRHEPGAAFDWDQGFDAAFDFGRPRGCEPDSKSDRGFLLGGSLLAPLLDSGRLQAQEEVVAARRDQATFAYRKTAPTAFREVEDALAAEQRLTEQEVAQTAQRDVLARALTLATNRYRDGYSPYLDQLDAERGLLSAELALVQTRSDRLTALVTLYQALGGGWQSAGSQETFAPPRTQAR